MSLCPLRHPACYFVRSPMVKRSVLVLGVLAACGQDRIEVRQGPSADYNHGALLTAVDTFVAAGRTPAPARPRG